MRLPFLTLLLLTLPVAAGAVDAPTGQVHLAKGSILRGSFSEQRTLPDLAQPMITTGHFAVAPGYGLIWGMEKPMATTTIITQNGIAQDIGGFAMKLPAKKLLHLYETVGDALAGDWSGLASDFIITPSGNASHWQMLLTPRPDASHPVAYAAITVSGGRYVEHILMQKNTGGTDAIDFGDEVLATSPPSAPEAALFGEVK